MNTKNFWIASLSGAAMSLLVTNLPILGFVNCLLCAGFWGSAIFAVWLYRRLSGKLTVSEGIRIGALSGLLAGGIGVLLSFTGLTGIQGLISGLQNTMPPGSLGDIPAIPQVAGTVANLLGMVMEVLFGVIGGGIGGAIFRTDRFTKMEGA
jgi:hypothetical protein